MEYSDYLALLSELCQLFDQISHVEQQKIDAVQGHALDELNEAMKREQALTLALRGCEQKRETLLTGLGLTGISLRDMPSHCPPEYRAETSRMVEQVLKGYAVLQAAQGSAGWMENWPGGGWSRMQNLTTRHPRPGPPV